MAVPPKNTGWRRVVMATRYSCAGLSAAWRHEAAFRQECLLAAILLPLAMYCGENSIERVLLAASVLWVLIVELLNSALEAAIDRIGAERHPLSGRAKDLASAAVMLSLLLAALTWGLILGARWLAG